MSMICMLVVACVTMAMVVVLSAFNGIENLIDERYSYFDADISILPVNDKVINEANLDTAIVGAIEGVQTVSKVIEERVFAQYEGNQRIIKLKGVEDKFIAEAGMDTMMIEGEANLHLEDSPSALMGVGVKYDLDLRLFEQVFNPLRLSGVIRGKNLRQNMDKALNNIYLPVAGVFSINIDFDSDYVLVPLDFAAELLKYDEEYSALEVTAQPGVDLTELSNEIQSQLGDNYYVRSRLEKNALIFKTNRTEKWATFMIMGFIMLIATFNIIAALTLLINEKRNDIKVLTSMGATHAMVKRIFLIEGALINLSGAALGVGLGFLFVYLQKNVGLISLEGGLVDYYPVDISSGDLIAIFGLVLACGVLSSIVPVQIFTRKYASD
jgi:lipoprotein-releasing system permease protein